MPIQVVCQGIVRFDKDTGQYVRCGAEFQAPDGLAGKSMRCPTCGEDVPVPKTSPVRTPAATAAHAAAAKSDPAPSPFSSAPMPPAPPAPPPPPWPSAPSFPHSPSASAMQTAPAAGAAPFVDLFAPAAAESSTAAPTMERQEKSAEEELYSLSPVEEGPRPAAAPHPLAAAQHVYQLGEADEAPERAVHSGWCDNCGNDMPSAATVCPKCGYQHGAAHVVFRKEPTPPPAMQVCPNCNEKLAPGVLLCEACGYHSGLKQVFPALAKRQFNTNEPPPTGLEQWVSRQVDGPSPKNAMLWLMGGLAVFIGMCVLTLAGLMFLIFGPWALCLLVPGGFLVLAAIIGFFAYYRKNAGGVLDRRRKGLEQAIWVSMLKIMRAIGWRSPAPPFTAYRSLDVRNTNFGDRDLATMKNLSEFEALDLEGTQITDAGLPYLAANPRLKFICVRKTRVTEQGAWSLQRAKADLWVWY
jgi:ribosomal protein L40E